MAIRAVVCYESKYGNTKRLAETIAGELQRVGGVEVSVASIRRVDIDDVANHDLILVGGPTHFGGPTRRVTKFIEALAKRGVSGRSIAVFDTYLGEDFEKSVKRMEEQLRATAPGLRIATPGLSIRVEDMRGPIVEGELGKCAGFVQRLVAPPSPP